MLENEFRQINKNSNLEVNFGIVMVTSPQRFLKKILTVYFQNLIKI